MSSPEDELESYAALASGILIGFLAVWVVVLLFTR